MADEQITKGHFSLKGWNFWNWLAGNWATIKELIKVGAPAVIGWVATHNPYWASLITVVGKFGLDLAEYWVKKYIAEMKPTGRFF